MTHYVSDFICTTFSNVNRIFHVLMLNKKLVVYLMRVLNISKEIICAENCSLFEKQHITDIEPCRQQTLLQCSTCSNGIPGWREGLFIWQSSEKAGIACMEHILLTTGVLCEGAQLMVCRLIWLQVRVVLREPPGHTRIFIFCWEGIYYRCSPSTKSFSL